MKVLVETVLNRSNFVTLISIICITLFILLQEVERETQQGKAIESFINTSFESFVLPQSPDIVAQNSIEGAARRYPSFVIIGMQKCGTGALKEFLKRNPFIGYSLFGESHFFDRTTNYQQGYEYYLSLQPEVQPEVMVFDKTPSLLSDQYMPERVAAYNASAKLIVMLCEPIRRSLSHYLHAKTLIASRLHGKEMGKVSRKPGGLRSFVYNASSFADVVDAAIDEIFKKTTDVKEAIHDMSVEFELYKETRKSLYEYIDDKDNYAMVQAIPQQLITRGAYGYYLNRWFELFPRENILITSATDLINDPAMVVKKIQEFVGVPIAVDEKNFVWDQETEHYCVIGPEDLDAKCMGSSKQRSKEFTVNQETKIKLSRIFSSVQQDLNDIVGNELFSDWELNL